MARIYNLAAQVVVWLGDSNLVIPEHEDTDLSVEEHDELRLQTYNEAVGDVIAQTKPLWWDRAWIIQEFTVLVFSPRVQVGALELRWGELIIAQQRPTWHLQGFRSLDNLAGLRAGEPIRESILICCLLPLVRLVRIRGTRCLACLE